MTDQRDKLSDDLDDIAGSIPKVTSGYGELRRLLGTLPNPLGPLLVGSTAGSVGDPAASLDGGGDMGGPVSDVLSGNDPGTQPGWDTSLGSSLGSDEAGQPTLTGLNASSAWFDFVRHGVYNARFLIGVVGYVPNGRTAALPYWTASDPDGAGPLLSFRTIGTQTSRVWVDFDAINKRKRLLSDFVPITLLIPYEVGIIPASSGVGSISFDVTVLWYKDDFTPSTVRASDTFTTTPVAGVVTNVYIAPSDAYYCRLQIDQQELGVHVAGAQGRLVSGWVRPNLVKFGSLTGDTLAIGSVVTGGGTLNMYGRANIDQLVLRQFGNADLSALTGAQNDTNVAASVGDPLTSVAVWSGASSVVFSGFQINGLGPAPGAILVLANMHTTGNTVTLVHDQLSTAGLRLYLPEGKPIVLAKGENVILVYDSGNFWHVIGLARHTPQLTSLVPTDTAEGVERWDDTTRALVVGDSVRAKPVTPVGWAVDGRPTQWSPTDTLANTEALALVAAGVGGAVAVPIRLEAPMLLHGYQVRSNDAASLRTAEMRLYYSKLNNNGTIDAVTGSDATDSFTPAAASLRSIALTGAAIVIPAGLYWFVFRNTSAAQTWGLAISGALTFNTPTYQLKSIAALGATVDVVTAWAHKGPIPGVRLVGRKPDGTNPWQ